MKKNSKKNKIYFGQDQNTTKKSTKKNKHNNDDTQQNSFSKQGIYAILKNTSHPMRLDDILRRLDVSRRSKKEVLFLLQELIDENKIIRQRGASYSLCTSLSHITGRLAIQRSGAGFVIVDTPIKNTAIQNTEKVTTHTNQINKTLNNHTSQQKDIYIPQHALNGAWNGDKVQVLLLPSAKPHFTRDTQKNSKQEGRITQILERAQTKFTACIENEAPKPLYRFFKHSENKVECAFIARPTDSRFPFRILLPLPTTEEFDAWREEEKTSSQPIQENIHTTDLNPYTLKQGDLVILQIEDATQISHPSHNTDTTPSKSASNTPTIMSALNTDLFRGKVIKKLGSADKVSVQEEITKHNHAIPTYFPDSVSLEAKEIAQKHGFFYTAQDEEDFKEPHLHKDAKNREAKHSGNIKTSLEAHEVDLRNLNLVTIDGADSKDFDDAIFVEKQDDSWRLVVAIADVSRYVFPFSEIDKEAKARANSYYFPSSVEPMIPPILSNGLCSLRPHEDHKIMFADMLFNHEGSPIKSSFGHGVMRSKARLTYEQVQDVYDKTHKSIVSQTKNSIEPKNAKNAFSTENNSIPSFLEDMLVCAKELAQILIQKRHKQGSLHLEIPEPKCVTKDNEIVRLSTRPHLFAHELIEAFMVNANEAVAEFLHSKNAPCLYRIHPAPAPERLQSLNLSLQSTSIAEYLPSLSPEQMGAKFWLSAILDNKERAEKKTLPNKQNNSEKNETQDNSSYLAHQLILRSMMQARYSPYLEEHFGLASSCYCHFTSPIRRYSDLMVHRSLKQTLGIIDKETSKLYAKTLSEDALLSCADTCNGQERVAQNAEREIFRRLACILLENEVNKEFEATISGVTPFGLFAQMHENMAEGMIRMENLIADYFIYEEESQCLFGQRTKKIYRLGDPIRVVLKSVDLSRLEINLCLAEDENHTFQRKSFTNTYTQKNTHNTKHFDSKNTKQKTTKHKSTKQKASKSQESNKKNTSTNTSMPYKDDVIQTSKESFKKKVHKQKKPKQNTDHKKKKDHKKKFQEE